MVQWRILLIDPHPPLLLVIVFSLYHLHLHLHGPVQQHDGEDQDAVEEGHDAAYLNNLQFKYELLEDNKYNPSPIELYNFELYFDS